MWAVVATWPCVPYVDVDVCCGSEMHDVQYGAASTRLNGFALATGTRYWLVVLDGRFVHRITRCRIHTYFGA